MKNQTFEKKVKFESKVNNTNGRNEDINQLKQTDSSLLRNVTDNSVTYNDEEN